jgi:hypothetical protein
LGFAAMIQEPIFQLSSWTRSRKHGIGNSLDILARLLPLA